jgi:hypothetical protein
MTRITLIRPAYSAHVYGATYQQDKDTLREVRPPLGLMAIAGYLKQYGHSVTIIDGEPDLLDDLRTVQLVMATNPKIVGITSTTPEYPFAYNVLKRIKRESPDLVTVMGGAHITNLPQHTRTAFRSRRRIAVVRSIFCTEISTKHRRPSRIKRFSEVRVWADGGS